MATLMGMFPGTLAMQLLQNESVGSEPSRLPDEPLFSLAANSKAIFTLVKVHIESDFQKIRNWLE